MHANPGGAMLARTQPLMELPEDLLLARCRRGDVEAFSRIHAEYEQVVFRHAYRLLGSRDDALDASQETFINAFRGIRSFRGDCSLRAWLLRICTNLCRNHSRSRQRRREVPMEDAAWQAVTGGADPQRELEARERSAAVWEALRKLSPAHREIIVLYDLEGVSTAEIAAILGCSRGSVPVKLFRARSRFKDAIQRLTSERE